jgi:hypothetical protein
MSDRRWDKAWPEEFKKDLKSAGLSDADIQALMKASSMEEASKYLPKNIIERDKALQEYLQERFGHR